VAAVEGIPVSSAVVIRHADDCAPRRRGEEANVAP
jgi:hypothetical protein